MSSLFLSIPDIKISPEGLIFISGAGRENRTLISSLENLHTNHCTIPAICKHKPGVGYRDRTDDLLDHNQTL